MQSEDLSFSVLMSVYERDDPVLLRSAVSSVFANELTPLELILVVDGPVGDALNCVISELVQRYPINCQCLSTNRGLASALNYGLNFVRTPLIARADADDINLPNRFSTQIETMRLGFDLVGSQIQEVDSQGVFLGIREVPCSHDKILKFSRARNPFNHMTVIYKTDLIRACGGYPVLYLREDYGLWALMISKGARLANTNSVLVHATAGFPMIKRRRGLRSALAEFELQTLFVKCGIKSRWRACLDCCLRASILMLSSHLLSRFYFFFLRRTKIEY